MKRVLMLGLMLAIIFFVGAKTCSKNKDKTENQISKVEKESFTHKLYYSGLIQPANTSVVTSPADGVIVDMMFQYGKKINHEQLLFTLSSAKFLADYKAALLQYIKAKNDFNDAKTQLSESEFLHKNQLISDDSFKSKQTSYYSARLGLLQAKDGLENLIHQVDVKDANVYKLSIADIDKITEAMHLQMNSENLRVTAPTSGTILSAQKSEEDHKKFQKGDIVKQGDVLAIIGDMSGVAVHIKVNELTVNQLREEQKVKVTGIAFPEYVLNGKISRIDRQGEVTGGGMPVFAVEITVPRLTQAQQEIIHAGMSANVEIDISEEAQIRVPMAAVKQKNGASYVKQYDKKTRQTKEVAVNTGKTTEDAVAIVSGLTSGDSIVVPY